jgi:transcriptional regulator GlxA family with amidase domain
VSEVDLPHTKRTVGILIFDDVEVLDFCGPFEVFSSSSIEGEAPREDRRLFKAITIAEERRTIVCRGGLLVQPNHTFADHPDLDIIVVPGGFGTRREVNNPVVLDWIASQSKSASLTTSVCTGTFLLAAAGILDGIRATSHWATLDDLRSQHPAIDVLEAERVVDEGKVITSAGVSAGIDMALYVVERLHGRQIAIDTARGMEYDWRT